MCAFMYFVRTSINFKLMDSEFVSVKQKHFTSFRQSYTGIRKGTMVGEFCT